ncbi:MAG: HAMP domain-containing histidine kinase, partial [Anaerolineae bacterium]|nr:HAMP domain-containing histidine kinase [Anaerolineae bacterium]
MTYKEPRVVFTYENLARYVREALAHFHDPAFLQTSPLIELLDPGATSEELQDLLRKKIESLRPDPIVPPERPEWMAYRILQRRYLHLESPYALCEELGISVASLYRYQHQAMEALIESLWREAIRRGKANLTTKEDSLGATYLERSVCEPIDIRTVLQSVQQIFARFASQEGLGFSITWPSSPLVLYGDPAVFHQIILNMLVGAVRIGIEETLHLEVQRQGSSVCCLVKGACSSKPLDQNILKQSELDLCQKLLGIYGSQLQVRKREENISLSCLIPSIKPPIVLIVEDYEDAR